MRVARIASPSPEVDVLADDGPPLLMSVDRLVAGYRRPVVGPVSLEVRRGEVIGVRGPNGAGKSTLLKALGGTARIFSGRVIRHVPALRVSHQQQNPLPLEDVPLSGRELLRLTGASSADLPEWIAPLAGRRLDRLSGGQLQFLQVWACLKAPVDVVLLDEPTNNLDTMGTRRMAEEIRTSAAGPAIVVVSHDPDFLSGVCHRIVEIEA